MSAPPIFPATARAKLDLPLAVGPAMSTASTIIGAGTLPRVAETQSDVIRLAVTAHQQKHSLAACLGAGIDAPGHVIGRSNGLVLHFQAHVSRLQILFRGGAVGIDIG